MQWITAGVDELDAQAAEADTASFKYALSAPDLYPSYRFKSLAVPGPGPNSPPLQEVHLNAEDEEDPPTSQDVDGRGTFGSGGLSAGYKNTFRGSDSSEDDVRRSRLV
jgi:hypothetical protein